MPRFAYGIAASDQDIASSDARTMRRQQTVADVSLGVGTLLGALGQFRAKSQRQADAAKQAELLAGMAESPAGRPTGQESPMPPGVAGPGAEVLQPWEQVIGQQMKSYHPPSLIANLGAMFSQLGGSQPVGQLQPQAGAELLALAGNRAFQRSQIQLNTMRASADDRRARAAEATAAAALNKDPIADLLVRMRGQSVSAATSLAGKQASMIDPALWAQMSPGARDVAAMQGHLPGNASTIGPMVEGAKTNAANLEKLIFSRLGNKGGGGGIPAPGGGAPKSTYPEGSIEKFLQDNQIDPNDPEIMSGKYDEILNRFVAPAGGGR